MTRHWLLAHWRRVAMQGALGVVLGVAIALAALTARQSGWAFAVPAAQVGVRGRSEVVWRRGEEPPGVPGGGVGRVVAESGGVGGGAGGPSGREGGGVAELGGGVFAAVPDHFCKLAADRNRTSVDLLADGRQGAWTAVELIPCLWFAGDDERTF